MPSKLLMSDLLALRISSLQEPGVTGIFFPNAIQGLNTLMPNSGLLLFQREDGDEMGFSSTESLVLGPVVDFEAMNIQKSQRTNLYIATIRIDIVKALLPSGCLVQVDQQYYEEVVKKNLKSKDAFVCEIPDVIIAPIGLGREQILGMCELIPALEPYTNRLKVVEVRLGESNLQIVIKDEVQEGLNAVLINMKDKHYYPTAQNVRLILGNSESGNEIYIATDNPRELEKCLSGAAMEQVDNLFLLEFLRGEGGIESHIDIFRIRSETSSLKGGFITETSYNNDIADSRREMIEDELRNF
jgi:hypothetical protein